MNVQIDEREFWRLFWINKYGSYPTKMVKVIRKLTFEEDNKESEELERDFQKFVKEYCNR